MTLIEHVGQSIRTIGERLVACDANCAGIKKSARDGILPRCLIFESDRRSSGRGSIVCGINPAPAPDHELRFYREHGISYASLLRYWEVGGLKNIPYYARLRAFVDGMGLDGPILWTDIAKCQNSDNEPLSLKQHPQTFRRCSSSFLGEELKLCPPDWPIIAAGREAYIALLYLCPDRPLIGVPHPTGQYANAQFLRLFDPGLKLRAAVRDEILSYFKTEPRGIYRVVS